MEVNQQNTEEVEVKEQVTIPDIIGKTITEAETILKENGLEIQLDTEEIDKQNAIVENQVPQPGIKAYKGTFVYVN